MKFNSIEKYNQARELAITSHKNQKYGDKPYEYHLQAVVDVLIRFGAKLDDKTTAPILIAAWLHDSLEDTALTYEQIEVQFGQEVAELVWRVTDESGASRKERKSATYCKTQQNPSAVILKLADRIANVEASLANDSKFSMYKNEYTEFKQALQSPSANSLAIQMWDYLDQFLIKK